MIRSLSGRVVLLVLAILFVVALLKTKKQEPPMGDPVGDARTNLQQLYGLAVDRQATPPAGLLVTGLTPQGFAQRLGLKVGDRVLAVNEQSVWHAKQLDDYLGSSLGRAPVRLMVLSGTQHHVLVIGGGGGRRPAGRPASGGPGPRAGGAGRPTGPG